MTSCFLSVARTHFATTCKALNQPHTLALQLNFVRRTSNGPAILIVSELKLGRRTSTIHISLSQGEQPPCVLGYLMQSNFDTEAGISLKTAYSLCPAPKPLVSTVALRDDSEPNWSLHHKPFSSFRKAGQHVRTYLPRDGQVGQALIDQWLCLENEQRFTSESLGYVADMFPQIVEAAYGPEDLEREGRKVRSGSGQSPDAPTPSVAFKGSGKSQWAEFWYPTVLLNLEFKKALPLEGVEWLFSRVRSKEICNGRMDLEVIIMDENGAIVALSNHVALVVSAERNMNRSAQGSKEDGSRL